RVGDAGTVVLGLDTRGQGQQRRRGERRTQELLAHDVFSCSVERPGSASVADCPGLLNASRPGPADMRDMSWRKSGTTQGSDRLQEISVLLRSVAPGPASFRSQVAAPGRAPS